MTNKQQASNLTEFMISFAREECLCYLEVFWKYSQLHVETPLKCPSVPIRLLQVDIRQTKSWGKEDSCYTSKISTINKGKRGERESIKNNQLWNDEFRWHYYFKRSINSLKPRTTIATIAHGGGSQLLLFLCASCSKQDRRLEVLNTCKSIRDRNGIKNNSCFDNPVARKQNKCLLFTWQQRINKKYSECLHFHEQLKTIELDGEKNISTIFLAPAMLCAQEGTVSLYGSQYCYYFYFILARMNVSQQWHISNLNKKA